MRFDDSLDTVLSADMTTSFGAQSAWRQLVDLIGRRRVPADHHAIARLAAIRADVPPPVRAASARALAFANPPAALVRLFAEDEPSIAAPVLRVAQMRADQWIELLPILSPAGRSILRHRRDLAPEVRRALESFGSVDFRLPGGDPVEVVVEETGAEEPLVEDAATAIVESAEYPAIPLTGDIPDDVRAIDWSSMTNDAAPVIAAPLVAADAVETMVDWTDVIGPEAVEAVVVTDAQPAPVIVEPTFAVAPVEAVDAPAVIDAVIEPTIAEQAVLESAFPEPIVSEPIAAESLTSEPVFVPPIESPFVSLGTVAFGLPVVAEALRRAEDEALQEPVVDAVVADIPVAEPVVVEAPVAELDAQGPFQIAELVKRIDAYQKQRDDTPAVPLFRDDGDAQPALFDLEPVKAPSFRFETDAGGIVRWIEGAARAPLIGLSLDLAALPSGSRVDGVAAGAFRRRAGFANARLVVDGNSDAAGQWRITGIPVFDRESGRFTGYRGTARRPRADESAEPVRPTHSPQTDALRQLVHELRTPTNAIAGFAEMIETQLLGPVPQGYRDHAGAIRGQAADLLTAIDDIDMAARIESNALDLRPGQVEVAPLLARVAGDLAPLAGLRGTILTIDPGPLDMVIAGDDRAVERLVARLMATLVASGSQDETIGVVAALDHDAHVVLTFDRPRTLAAYGAEAILTIDAEAEAEAEGAPLLGTGFALRLARNLATELGGALVIGEKSLTLRLPAAVIAAVEQASSS